MTQMLPTVYATRKKHGDKKAHLTNLNNDRQNGRFRRLFAGALPVNSLPHFGFLFFQCIR
jgi:hypothetical protein